MLRDISALTKDINICHGHWDWISERQLWSKRNKTNSTLIFILKQNIWINQIWLKTYLRPQMDLIIPQTGKQTVVISKQRTALLRSSYQLDADVHGKLIFQNTGWGHAGGRVSQHLQWPTAHLPGHWPWEQLASIHLVLLNNHFSLVVG